MQRIATPEFRATIHPALPNPVPKQPALLVPLAALMALLGGWMAGPAEAADYTRRRVANGSEVETISEPSGANVALLKSRVAGVRNLNLLVICTDAPSLCSLTVSGLFPGANSGENGRETIELVVPAAAAGQGSALTASGHDYSSMIMAAEIGTNQSMEIYSLVGLSRADLQRLSDKGAAILRIGGHTEVMFRPKELGLERLGS